MRLLVCFVAAAVLFGACSSVSSQPDAVTEPNQLLLESADPDQNEGGKAAPVDTATLVQLSAPCDDALDPVRAFMAENVGAVLDDDLREALREVSKPAYDTCPNAEFSTFQVLELEPWGESLQR